MAERSSVVDGLASGLAAGLPVEVGSRLDVIRLKDVDSTSAHVKRLIQSDTQGRMSGPLLVVSKKQSAGVGRFGRAWKSPAGGLWMTMGICVPAAELPGHIDGLGLRVGIACLRVMRRVVDESISPLQRSGAQPPLVRLKWPNDVLISGRKALGVLSEVVFDQSPAKRAWMVIGVGVNVNISARLMHEALTQSATSLKIELGQTIELNRLEQQFFQELQAACAGKGLTPGLIHEAAESLHGLGRDIRVTLPDGSGVVGVLQGLNDQGMAVLDVEGRVFVAPIGSVIMQESPGADDEGSSRGMP